MALNLQELIDAIAEAGSDSGIDAAIAEECERSLLNFVEYLWPFVEPAQPFVYGWAIEAVCDHLEAVHRGEIKRLLINVPPGFMKDCHVDDLVLTKQGRIRLGDIVVGDMVLTHMGRYRKVIAVHENGIKPTIQITTNAGRILRPEITHPFLTPRGIVRANELIVGDVLGAVTPIEDMDNDEITPEEARLLGYIVGDGGVAYSPTFHNTEEYILSDFEQCAWTIGLKTRRAGAAPSLKARGAIFTRIGIRGALPWLGKYGLKGKNSYTKRIPDSVLRSSREIIANFLGAYWSCDGTFNVRHSNERGSIFMASCTTVSKDLAYDIQHALLRIGVSSRVRARLHSKVQSKKQPGGYWSYEVITTSHEETAKIKYAFRGLMPRKKAIIDSLILQKFVQGPLVEDKIVSIDVADPGECRCLTVEEDHTFTTNDIAVHNSMAVNVFFPAWEWGPMNRPSTRYISASYSSSLTERDNLRFRQVIMSDLYRRIWGDRFGPSKEKFAIEQVMNDRTGWKLASSVSGVSTGARSDRLLIDDPNSVKEAESKVIRDSTNHWFNEVVPTRLNNPATSSIIVIQQRTNEDDVSGNIMARELDYEHLMIPMEYDSKRHCSTSIGWNDPRGTVDGDPYGEPMTPSEQAEQDGVLAFPERFPPQVVTELKETLGPYATAGQLQQSPAPRGGGIFKDHWWKIWPPEEIPESALGYGTPYPPFDYIIASLDSAFTEKEESDPSAMVVLGMWHGGGVGKAFTPPRLINDDEGMMRLQQEPQSKVMLIYAWEKRLDFRGPPEEIPPGVTQREWNSSLYKDERTSKWGIVDWVLDTCRSYRVDHLIVEAKATGITVAQELQKQLSKENFTIELYNPSHQGDKVSRAHGVVHLFSNGRVYAPMTYNKELGEWAHPAWCQMVLDRMRVFPKGAHNDIVDAMTMGLRHLRDIGVALRSEEEDQIVEDNNSYKRSGGALYDV